MIFNSKPQPQHFLIEDSSNNNLLNGDNLTGSQKSNDLRSALGTPAIQVLQAPRDPVNNTHDADSVYHHKGIDIKPPQIETIIKEGDFESYQDPVKLMLGKIVRCKRGEYLKTECKHCKIIITDQGEEIAVRITCDNRFCDDEFCIISRRIRAMKRLESYKIKTSQLIHVEISFPLQVGETKEKQQRRALTMRYIHQGFKKIGIDLHALMVWDIRVKESHGIELYFMHFHLAILPINFQRFWRAQSIVRRNVIKKAKQEFTIHVEGWRPTESLMTYFSKIMAGEVSVGEEHHTAHYKDFLSPEEYHKLFYKKKMLRSWNMKVGKCMSRPETAQPFLMFEGIGLTFPENCPNCNHELLKGDVRFIKVLDDQKPPDGSQDYRFYGMNLYETASEKEFSNNPINKFSRVVLEKPSTAFYSHQNPAINSPKVTLGKMQEIK